MKYVIYGLGISGLSTAKFLTENGENVIATDDNEQSIKDAQQKFNHIKFLKPDEIDYDSKTIISLSPGIPLYFPKAHKILDISKKTGASITCDIEVFYQRNLNNNFIAITGTNGKSTTSALTGFIFKELNIPSQIGGNIGIPCFDLTQKTEDFSYIFETSSYQLDLINKTRFNIAALLNITPDHIDRHGSLDGYIAAKKRVFQNQIAGDFALIDIDNENSKKVFDELKQDKNFQATLVPISTKKVQENGISLFKGKLTNNIAGNNSHLDLTSKFLCGDHNDQNMAFAFAITYCYQLVFAKKYDEKSIITAIKKFSGLAHRLDLLGNIDEISFINDSKATNAESSKNALKAYDNIFWILGGRSKTGGISSLKPYFNKVKKAYLIGESSKELAKTLKESAIRFEECGNLEIAFKKAYIDAKNVSLSRKNILLSPACASLDQWKNFEQRGNYFCKLFNELSKS